MACPECGAETLSFPVPEDVRDLLPDERAGAAVCTRCLFVTPEDDPPADLPDFAAASDALPRDPERAVTVVCLLALLDSLALYRSEIEGLAREAERAGVDVLLVLDRLGADPDLEPHLDLGRRRRQLEQLLQ
jgi:hypothetical protein